MIIKEEIEISIYKEKRTLHIYVPDHLKKGQRCTVIYMYDGHNLFNDEDATYGVSWGLKDYLDAKGYPIMIVGLECNHKSNLRLCEFSPYDFYDPEWGEVEASGKELTRWLVEELKPYIDSNYPTYQDRKHTAIGGSSMGGLMALYGGFNYSNIFSKALCLSPYTYYVIKDILFDLKRASLNNDTAFYISYGSKECEKVKDLITYTDQIMSIQRAILDRSKVYLHLYKGHRHTESDWAKETRVWMKELGFERLK